MRPMVKLPDDGMLVRDCLWEVKIRYFVITQEKVKMLLCRGD